MPLDESQNPHTPTDWPEIDRSLLGEARPAPVAFPLHLLPGRWRAWVEASARPFASADYLAHGLLGGVAAVCGAGTVVHVTPQWREPLVLWQALVGGPSSGKSAAFARVRALLDAVKPHEEGGDRFAGRVLVDFPFAQLNWPLGSSSRGVLLWRDLADWMEEAKRREERPAWLAAWNAGPAMVKRRDLECFAVGILGALSPDRLAPGFVDGDRALAARFLYVWPQGEAAPSLASEPADDEGVVALLQKIADFAGHPETPGRLFFDEPAVRHLEEIMARLQQRSRELDGLEAEWIAKGVSTIVRLAGLLSLMEWAEGAPDTWAVTRTHLEAAHELWGDYCLPQAMAVFDRAGVSGCELAARRTAGWLKRVRATEISREDVRRQALCQTVNAEGAEDVLARLEQGGLVRLVETRTPGRTRRRWTVNPALR